MSAPDKDFYLPYERIQRREQKPALLPEAPPWCDLCNSEPSVSETVDGFHACQECAKEFLAAKAKYEADMAEVDGLHVGPNRAQRRAARRKQRLHNDGRVRQ
jgi:hypothetical protein